MYRFVRKGIEAGSEKKTHCDMFSQLMLHSNVSILYVKISMVPLSVSDFTPCVRISKNYIGNVHHTYMKIILLCSGKDLSGQDKGIQNSGAANNRCQKQKREVIQ